MPPSIRIVKINKHSLFEITDLKALIMSYMQYEDAVKIYEYFKLPEPRRPLALNLTDLFNFLTAECLVEQIYIPISYEGVLDLMDLFELSGVKLTFNKSIHKQCPRCLNILHLTILLLYQRE